jgi:hypothetical protein
VYQVSSPSPGEFVTRKALMQHEQQQEVAHERLFTACYNSKNLKKHIKEYIMYRFICTSYKIKLGQTWFQDQRN